MGEKQWKKFGLYVKAFDWGDDPTKNVFDIVQGGR